MNEPEYGVGRPSTETAYGPASVLGVAAALVLMAITTVVPNVNPLLGWALFAGPPLAGMVTVAVAKGRPRQFGLGLAASGTALATALIFGILSSLA